MTTNSKVAIIRKESLKSLNSQFAEYTIGKRKKFDLKKIGLHPDLRELKAAGCGTDLQIRVWQELLRIPYGAVISYEELAKRAGKPKAVRAVASAVGKNPLYILIPCHRVLPKSGVAALAAISKTPFKTSSGAPLKTMQHIDVGEFALGADIKEALLQIENVI